MAAVNAHQLYPIDYEMAQIHSFFLHFKNVSYFRENQFFQLHSEFPHSLQIQAERKSQYVCPIDQQSCQQISIYIFTQIWPYILVMLSDRYMIISQLKP